MQVYCILLLLYLMTSDEESGTRVPQHHSAVVWFAWLWCHLFNERRSSCCCVICMIFLLPSLWRREGTPAASIPGWDCAHTHVCLHTDDVHNFVWKLFWHGWWSANRQQSLHKVDILQDLIRCSPPTLEKLAAGLLVGRCYCRGPVTRRVNVLHSWFYHFSTCGVYLWCHFLSNWQEESTTVGASDHFYSWMQWGWRFCCVCCLLAVCSILRKMWDNGERRD